VQRVVDVPGQAPERRSASSERGDRSPPSRRLPARRADDVPVARRPGRYVRLIVDCRTAARRRSRVRCAQAAGARAPLAGRTTSSHAVGRYVVVGRRPADGSGGDLRSRVRAGGWARAPRVRPARATGRLHAPGRPYPDEAAPQPPATARAPGPGRSSRVMDVHRPVGRDTDEHDLVGRRAAAISPARSVVSASYPVTGTGPLRGVEPEWTRSTTGPRPGEWTRIDGTPGASSRRCGAAARPHRAIRTFRVEHDQSEVRGVTPSEPRQRSPSVATTYLGVRGARSRRSPDRSRGALCGSVYVKSRRARRTTG
jgi:hypothetical protein